MMKSNSTPSPGSSTSWPLTRSPAHPLTRSPAHPLTHDQADYVETLAELAEAYESATDEMPASLTPHEFLAAHLGNIGMTASGWGKLIGIDRSTASRLLRGERKFNTAHVRKTAEALNLEASILI
jgi:antitoxin component HigA of HigAB toxin-antitoxin module